jgi:hypothetical protein
VERCSAAKRLRRRTTSSVPLLPHLSRPPPFPTKNTPSSYWWRRLQYPMWKEGHRDRNRKQNNNKFINFKEMG